MIVISSSEGLKLMISWDETKLVNFNVLLTFGIYFGASISKYISLRCATSSPACLPYDTI